jgi:16S rRNA (cytosine967-C5)-methyltransferase
MKLHKNLVDSIATTLQEIFNKNRYADKAIEKLFKQNPKWGSRDRRFVAEAIYDIVRNYRLYSELAQSPKNFWFITAVWMVLKEIELPSWQEFKHVDAQFIRKQKDNFSHLVPLAESYPDWLWELGTQELGKDLWQKEAVAMNQLAPVVLRVNPLKTSAEQFEASFREQNIEIIKTQTAALAYQLVKRENIFQNKLFKDGWFEVQDAGSQQIGEFTNPAPGDLVIDACAGAGGKSLHLAALMKNKGKIISMDVEGHKLEELKKRAKRAGAFNIETRTIENISVINKLAKKADKVLLDVPCSGLGVIKRNPDAKWKLSHDTINKTKGLQQQILADYAEMVKPKGTLIYSTCSILPSENREQINKFLEHNSDFAFESDKTIFPSEGYDGFYMCQLKRIN